KNYIAARRLYDSARNQQAAIYNGVQHMGYGNLEKGTAYFLTPDWSNGNVIYDGMFYRNIPLHYDILADELIVESPNGFGIILFSPRVEYFTIEGHRFINVADPQVTLSPGFYDVLLQGAMTILVRRHKRINETITGTESEREYIEADDYYLMMDGRFHSIRNEEDIMQYTGNMKKEIKKILKKNHVHFKKEMEQAIKLVAGTYNQ
ncbi:MAG: hypothetical protein ACJ75F_09105, partial [Flavisolibacter sp.]